MGRRQKLSSQLGVQVCAVLSEIDALDLLMRGSVSGLTLRAGWSKAKGFELDVYLPAPYFFEPWQRDHHNAVYLGYPNKTCSAHFNCWYECPCRLLSDTAPLHSFARHESMRCQRDRTDVRLVGESFRNQSECQDWANIWHCPSTSSLHNSSGQEHQGTYSGVDINNIDFIVASCRAV